MGLTSVLARSLTYNTHSHAACGAAGISLDLSHVMANVNHRAKSADPVGMGVSALNNDDQGAYEGGGAGVAGGAGGEFRPASVAYRSSSHSRASHDDDYGRTGSPFGLAVDTSANVLGGSVGGGGYEMTEPAGGQSMLQPMSPAQPPADGGMFGANMPHLDLDQGARGGGYGNVSGQNHMRGGGIGGMGAGLGNMQFPMADANAAMAAMAAAGMTPEKLQQLMQSGQLLQGVAPGMEAAHLASMQAIYAHHMMMMLQAASASMAGQMTPDAAMLYQQQLGVMGAGVPTMPQLGVMGGSVGSMGGGGMAPPRSRAQGIGHNSNVMGGAGSGGMYGNNAMKMNGGVNALNNLAAMSMATSLGGGGGAGLQAMGSNSYERGRKTSTGIDVSKLMSIEQVTGQVYTLSRDQLGCRFLQKQLEDNPEQSLDVIFNEVMEHMVELMTDPFGNYLCQKLLDCCSRQQREAIVQCVAPHLVGISVNIHGTRAAQKLIERLGPEHSPSSPEIEEVVEALKAGVVKLIQDLNGNHVVQRCLQKLDAVHNQFIYDAISANCFHVASHRHGCCVFQRCVDFANPHQQHQVVMEVVDKTVLLVQDAFGNYVVQYVLEQVPQYRHNIINIIAQSIIQLSRQKFSSNVVEKCLQLASPEGQALMVTSLAQKDQILTLLQDPYANYVVQRALQVANSPHLEVLADAIRPHMPAIRNTSYGRRIQSKIVKRCPGGIDSMPTAEQAMTRMLQDAGESNVAALSSHEMMERVTQMLGMLAFGAQVRENVHV